MLADNPSNLSRTFRRALSDLCFNFCGTLFIEMNYRNTCFVAKLKKKNFKSRISLRKLHKWCTQGFLIERQI